MRTLPTFGVCVAFALLPGAGCFGPHSRQTSLASRRDEGSRFIEPRFVNISGDASDTGSSGKAFASEEDRIEKPHGWPPASRSDIHARITSTPAGADIQVDGTYVGITPLDIDLSCCFHDVTISKPGRRPWTGRVRNNGHADIHAQLPK